MKKLFYFSFLIIFVCLCFCNNYCFIDTLKSLDLAEYKVFLDSDEVCKNFDDCLLSGDVKIYTFLGQNIDKNLPVKNALCEQVVLSKNSLDKYIKNNNFDYIKSEEIDEIIIDYYYSKKLPKKVCGFGSFYNIVVAKNRDKIIVGYPTIMGSI